MRVHRKLLALQVEHEHTGNLQQKQKGDTVGIQVKWQAVL